MHDPALNYLLNRIRRHHPDQWTLAMHGAVADLLYSDIPLSPAARRLIAGTYLWLAFPTTKREARKHKGKVEGLVAASLTQYLRSIDKTPGEAEREVADVLNISPETLRRKRVVTIHR
jgi:hypothetical protein